MNANKNSYKKSLWTWMCFFYYYVKEQIREQEQKKRVGYLFFCEHSVWVGV